MYLIILALWMLIDFSPLILQTLDTSTRSFAVTKVTIYIGDQLRYVVVIVAMSKFFKAIFSYFLKILTCLATFGPLINLSLLGCSIECMLRAFLEIVTMSFALELLFPCKLYFIPHCSLIRFHVTFTTELLNAYYDFLFPRYDQFNVKEKSDSLASLLRLQSFATTYSFWCIILGIYRDFSSTILALDLLLLGWQLHSSLISSGSFICFIYHISGYSSMKQWVFICHT